tara:strand:- start:4726 stop:5184 length:459 start_codon:yes stop_codon:yes gene_type:complete
MSENIEFSKQVFNKNQYNKIIDTSFKQLGVKTPQEQLEETPTINDFFQMYNELFYDIPETGPTNSHEFLIQQSSEYINFEPNNEEIEALQNEIAQLRTELLDTQRNLIESQTGINIDELPNNTSLSSTPLTTTSTSGGSVTGGSSGGSGGGY